MGVRDLNIKGKEKIGIQIGDTVIVGKIENNILTSGVPKAFSDAYHQKEKTKRKSANSLGSKESVDMRKKKKIGNMDAEGSPSDSIPKVVIRTRRQKQQLDNGKNASDELEERNQMIEHQRQLVKDKNREMKERLNRGEFILANSIQM